MFIRRGQTSSLAYYFLSAITQLFAGCNKLHKMAPSIRLLQALAAAVWHVFDDTCHDPPSPAFQLSQNQSIWAC